MAGVPFWDLLAANESGSAGYGAKNPQSSATGKYQMIEPFFQGLLRKYRPGLVQQYGSSAGAWNAHSRSPELQEEFRNLGDQDNATTARNKGVNYDDSNKGLFWRLGAPKAIAVMSADPNTPLSNILGPDVMRVNKDLHGKTAGDIVSANGYPNKPIGRGDNMSHVPPGFDANNTIAPSQTTPMSMAMNGGIPGMAEQFQMATPLGAAMKSPDGEYADLGQGPKFGFQGADAAPEARTPGYDWGGALMGAGAGLSSITNPGGAAAMVALMKERNGDQLSAYERAILALKQADDAREAQKEGDAAHKDQVGEESRVISALDAINDQKALAAEIRQDPSLDRVTGVMGVFPNWPGGKAEALQGKIDQLKARGIFQVLGDIKRQSPTGSGLGQVSNYENDKMEKAFAALKQSIGTADFQKNLKLYEDQSERSMTNLRAAYEKQYHLPLPGYDMSGPQTGSDPVEDDGGFKILGTH